MGRNDHRFWLVFSSAVAELGFVKHYRIMRYQVKKPDVLLWTVLVTDSLSAEVESGRINWNWRIRQDGEPGEWSVLELAEAQQYSGKPSGEPSDETKSYRPPANSLCYLLIGEDQTGPYTPEQIRSMWTNGQITAETLYWFDGLGEWFPARNFCAPPVRAGAPSPQKSGSDRQLLGRVLAILGLLIAGYFFFVYDTTVEMESRYISGYGTVGGQRVHNTGLMQNRLLGCIGGLVLTTIGVVLVITPQKPPSA